MPFLSLKQSVNLITSIACHRVCVCVLARAHLLSFVVQREALGAPPTEDHNGILLRLCNTLPQHTLSLSPSPPAVLSCLSLS